MLSGEDINSRMVRKGWRRSIETKKAFDIRPYIELEQEPKEKNEHVEPDNPGSEVK